MVKKRKREKKGERERERDRTAEEWSISYECIPCKCVGE
jgi:hypothetical protein